jgi:DNA-binding transcriptional MocR family regulator
MGKGIERRARYRIIARQIIDSIESGALGTGDKLPSLRAACQRWRVSLITIKGAYRLLEQGGYIDARPQSGYYVLAREVQDPPSAYTVRAKASYPNDELRIITQIIGARTSDGIRALGAAIPGEELLPLKSLRLYASRIARRSDEPLSAYGDSSGSARLREEIARYYRSLGARVLPGDIVVHNGALNAITTTLRAITRPGDSIVLESPTYYLFMHAAAALNLRVVSVPHIPGSGIDLKALGGVLRSHPIKAIVVIPNFHNPAGSLMSLAAKEELLGLAARHKIHIIEDDVYGDLGFTGERPAPLLALDRSEQVIHCSSVSKILGPGLRVGWSISRALRSEIQQARFLQSIACPTLTQEVVAEFFSNEGLKRHRRLMGTKLAAQAEIYRAALRKYLPAGTRITQPEGGFLFWVELPKGCDTTALFHSLAHKHTGLTPGIIFGNQPEARRFFRLSFGASFSPQVDQSIARIGDAVQRQLEDR